MKKLAIIIAILFIQFKGYTQNAEAYLGMVKSVVSADMIKAESIVSEGLLKFPDDHDLRAYGSRIKAWQKKYAEAIHILNALLEDYPNDREGLSIKLDVLLWQNEMQKLITCANLFNEVHGRNLKADTYIIKSYIYNMEYGKARKYWAETYAYHGKSEELGRLNDILISYKNTFISMTSSMMIMPGKYKPTYIITAGIGQKSKTPWVVNYIESKTFATHYKTLQLEVYPRLAKNTYIFLDAAYTGNKLFSINYLGSELFHSIRNIELSAGYKVYNFEYNRGIMKGSISGYFNHFYLSYRSYIKIDPGFPVSHAIVGRFNMKSEKQYLEISYVNGRDQIFPTIYQGRPNYNSSVSGKYQHFFKSNVIAHAGFALRSQIYNEGQKMTGKEFQMGFKKLF